jgi:hypothetical protein
MIADIRAAETGRPRVLRRGIAMQNWSYVGGRMDLGYAVMGYGFHPGTCGSLLGGGRLIRRYLMWEIKVEII